MKSQKVIQCIAVLFVLFVSRFLNIFSSALETRSKIMILFSDIFTATYENNSVFFLVCSNGIILT